MKPQRMILALLAALGLAVPSAAQPIAAQTRPVQPMAALPMALAPQVTVTAIAAGGMGHTCALTSGGGVKCWGANNYGQLGDGTTTTASPFGKPTPVDVSGLKSGVSAITTGAEHTCALTSGNGVKCWGHNSYGQLGDGTTTDRTTPVGVNALGNNVIAIAAGWEHTCALMNTLTVMCWGRNNAGQLGNGMKIDSTTPVNVSGLTTVIALGTGQSNRTCAVTALGNAKCWGSNGLGSIGDGTTTDRTTPVNVLQLLVPVATPLTNVAAIATGLSLSCFRISGGGAKCTGGNLYGQLGNGTNTDQLIPVNVLQSLSPPGGTPLSQVTAIATGAHDACALTSGGGVKCWGNNSEGQLGAGPIPSSVLPVDVLQSLGGAPLSGITAITMGYYHNCALTTAGRVKCWGANYYGQLGNGTTTNSNTPVDVVFVEKLYLPLVLNGSGGVPPFCTSGWSPLGTGSTGPNPTNIINAIAASGSGVYAGGEYLTSIGGVSSHGIAKWDGNSWSALGTGLSGGTQWAEAIAVSGNDVYVGGAFTQAGGVEAFFMAKWNGSSWSAMPGSSDFLTSAIAINGSDVYRGGGPIPLTTTPNFVAKWNGSGWSALGTGPGTGAQPDRVNAIAVSGSDVYAGGSFATAGGLPASNVAKWNGSSWSPLGTGVNDTVNAIAISGSDVYVGGKFSWAGTGGANYIAKWNGSSWSPLGTGTNGEVNAITVSGSNVYVGGKFNMVGGVANTSHIAKWDGSNWSALGTGTNGDVNAIGIGGSNVYVGGDFTQAGGVAANNIACYRAP